MKKAVYIGAGLDIKYLNYLDFDILIAIDSQPKSEFGTFVVDGCERPDFLDKLKQKYKKCGFEPVLELSNNNEYILFQKQKQQIYFYYSVAFPEEITEDLKEKLCNYTMLICDGYLPRKQIFDFMSNSELIQFIGSDCTCYTDKISVDVTNIIYEIF